jgi:hypothetical protein
MTMKKPNFFIVGAPKCGTTALYSYLGEHPEIFIPDTSGTMETVLGGKKELHFFGRDLKFNRPTTEEYLAYFSNVQNEKRVGESSVFYLYSKTAAQEIKEFSPSAKIIAMLRNPIDMLYSWHSQLLFWGDEDLSDFKVALQVEGDRKKGLKCPKRHDHPIECFFYRDLANFTEQLQRYFTLFDRENIHIIIFDDFKKDVAQTYCETLRFLGVDESFQPEFEVINSNKSIRNKALQDFVRRPPSTLRKISKILIPQGLRQSFRTNLLRFNIQKESRKPLDLELRRQLQLEFAFEVEQLSKLLGRDLTYWSNY